MDVEINLWAVVLAAASSMAVGALWYAKGTFGATWMKLAKVDEKYQRENSAKALGVAFASSLVMAYVLAHVTYLANQFYHESFMHDAVYTAFWMWFGFLGVRMLMHDTFEGRRKKLTLINIGNELVTIMVMALIIGAMQP